MKRADPRAREGACSGGALTAGMKAQSRCSEAGLFPGEEDALQVWAPVSLRAQRLLLQLMEPITPPPMRDHLRPRLSGERRTLQAT